MPFLFQMTCPITDGGISESLEVMDFPGMLNHLS
jgi:hypothetical protein